jgi:hypothetical protein
MKMDKYERVAAEKEAIETARLKLFACRAALDEVADALRDVLDWPVGYDDSRTHEALLFFLNHFRDLAWQPKQCVAFLNALEKTLEDEE